jgi:uncharacterized membrane protein
MKPLVVLIVTFIIAAIVLSILHGGYQFALAGRIAMSVMLAFTAIGHFMFSKGMAMMVPAFLPFKKAIVYLTGIMELTAAIGLELNYVHKLAGCQLILFFIVILPANIYAAMHRINHEKASMDGYDIRYLWFRVPLQLVFIGWVYVAAVLN